MSAETEVVVLVTAVFVMLLAIVWYALYGRRVFLVDFVVLHPSSDYTVTFERFMVRGES